MFDLFGSANKVKAVEKQVLEQSRAMSDGSLNQTPPMDMFPAKLTAYDSATGYYSWTEQYYTTTGVRQDRVGGRTGTHTWMPAKMLNGAKVTTFPFQVTLIRTIHSDTLGVIYEALAGLPFEEMDLIDKICVTKNSGVVTDINIQRRTYLVAAVLPDASASSCSTTDEDCCPVNNACIEAACGDGATWSRNLTLTISGSGTALDGVSIPMLYGDTCSTDRWCGSYDCSGLGTLVFTYGCTEGVHVRCTSFGGTILANSSTNSIDDCDPLLITGVNTWTCSSGCGCTFCPSWTTFNWTITE